MNASILRPLVAAAVALGLAAPATAAAAPGTRDFARTFPSASRLCDRAAAGPLTGRLQGDDAAVKSACSSLWLSFLSAESTVRTTLAGLDAQVVAARATMTATCSARPRDRRACNAARLAVLELHADRWDAVRAERRALNAARMAYWNAITALRAGTGAPLPPTDPPPAEEPPPPPPGGPVVDV